MDWGSIVGVGLGILGTALTPVLGPLGPVLGTAGGQLAASYINGDAVPLPPSVPPPPPATPPAPKPPAGGFVGPPNLNIAPNIGAGYNGQTPEQRKASDKQSVGPGVLVLGGLALYAATRK